MSWRDQMRPASFKGVPFGVTGDDKEGGRRTVVHEFPQREDVYVEDMGGAVNRFTVQAFVLGADYFARRDALERVLTEPGPGTLVHPWYGEITVAQFAPYKVKHTAMDGGMAVFTLSFVRDAEPEAPRETVNTKIRALEKAASAEMEATGFFDEVFAVAGQTEAVVNAAYDSVVGALEEVKSALGGALGDVADYLGAATGTDLLQFDSIGGKIWQTCTNMAANAASSLVPSSLSSLVPSSVSSLASSTLAGALEAGSASLISRAENWLTHAAEPILSPVASLAGVTRSIISSNDVAVKVLTRNIGIVEGAKALAGLVPESRTQAASLKELFMDATDAVTGVAGRVSAVFAPDPEPDPEPEPGPEPEPAVMARFAMPLAVPVAVAAATEPATDAETEPSVEYAAVPPLPDSLYAAILDLRSPALAALAAAARSAPDVTAYTPAAVLPSLVVCHRLSGAIALDADLVARNGLIHPGFVPVESLEVLTYE